MIEITVIVLKGKDILFMKRPLAYITAAWCGDEYETTTLDGIMTVNSQGRERSDD